MGKKWRIKKQETLIHQDGHFYNKSFYYQDLALLCPALRDQKKRGVFYIGKIRFTNAIKCIDKLAAIFTMPNSINLL